MAATHGVTQAEPSSLPMPLGASALRARTLLAVPMGLPLPFDPPPADPQRRSAAPTESAECRGDVTVGSSST